MIWRTLNERIYRLLLLLFPHGFRRVYGDEMAAVFRHRWERSRFPKWGRVWALSISDAAPVLPFEWVSAAGELWHEMRETRWASVPASLLADVRFSVRSLIRKPAHLAVAAMSLALGIGFNIVMFAVVNGLILQPLPFAGADRLAYIVKRHDLRGWITSPDPEVVRELAGDRDLFEAVEPLSSASYTLLGGAEPRVISAVGVSETFMGAFGVTPLLGRGFRPGDAHETEPSLVLSEHLWRSVFGEDEDIVGRDVNLDGSTYTVLGVVAGNFTLGMTGTPDAWTLRDDESGPEAVLGRLTPGTSLAVATARAVAIAAGIEEQEGLSSEDWTEAVVAPFTFLGADFARIVWILLAAVGVLLLIACSNLANMTLAKGLGRSQELGIRRALGAGTLSIIRLLMFESVTLSLLGGALGLALAHWGLEAVRQIRPAYVSALDFVAIGPRIWLGALVVSMGAALLFGLLPTLRLAGADFNPALRTGSRFSSGTTGDRRARRALVAVEVALALPLTIAAGLMARTVYDSTHQNFGVELDGLIQAQVILPEDAYGDESMRSMFWARLQEQIEASPIDVDVVVAAPFAPPRFSIVFGEPRIEGRELSGTPQQMTSFVPAPTGYFALVGTHILHGRAFETGDIDGNVVVVNETLARRMADDGNPLGMRISMGDVSSEEDWLTVVGVAENVIGSAALDAADRLQVYFPSPGASSYRAHLLMRTDATVEALLPMLRESVGALDPTVPINEVKPVRQTFMEVFGRQRFAATLFASFGIVGLILAAAGIHGVVSLSVNQRLPELGVRMVFGARTADVARTVFTDGLAPVAIGAGIGILGTFAVMGTIPANLIQRSPGDPWLIAVLTAGLMVVGAAACVGPVWRAVRLDPVDVLRSD